MSLRRLVVSFIFIDLFHMVFRNDGSAAASRYHHSQKQRRQAFFQESKKVRLTDHVLQILDVDSNITCAHHCLAFRLENTQCQSFNYQNQGSASARCELNNSTIEENPENATKDDKFSYFYRLKVPQVLAVSRVKCINEKDLTKNAVNEQAVDYEVFQDIPKLQALGVENGNIPDAAMNASSIFSSSYQPYYARLNQCLGACSWTPSKLESNPSAWLQVDLGLIETVTAVSTQGGGSHLEWVKAYAILYSLGEVIWVDYKENATKKIFIGNADKFTVVTNSFQPPITARFMRIYPQNCYVYCSLRIEYYGY